VPPIDSSVNIPFYWIRPALTLGSGAGVHRFVWDLHGAPLAVLDHGYPISAVFRDTPLEPRGPLVRPGRYTVTLKTGSETATGPLLVKMDPRVLATATTLNRQYALATALAGDMKRDHDALAQVRGLRRQLAALRVNPAADSLKAAIDSVDANLAGFESGKKGLAGLNGDLAQVYGIIEGADVAPTSQAERAVLDLKVDLELTLKMTKSFTETLVPALNRRLKAAHLPTVLVGARGTVERRIGNGEADDEP
jgi:hypothetical protein